MPTIALFAITAKIKVEFSLTSVILRAMIKNRKLTASLMRSLVFGRPLLDEPNEQLTLVDEAGAVLLSWRLRDLSPADLGYAFERQVGLSLEDQGFEVDYRGLRLKMQDGGIDLVAIAPSNELHFYQCKATAQSIGPQEIETILFKAGNFIARQQLEAPCHLVLAVANLSIVSGNALQRWTRHNSLQNKVRLRIEEHPWRLASAD